MFYKRRSQQKTLTFGRIFVDFQPRLLSSRICSRFPLQKARDAADNRVVLVVLPLWFSYSICDDASDL